MSGHHGAWATLASANAIDLGSTGALDGGVYVNEDTMSKRYSVVNVLGPGREIVPGIWGIVIKLVKA
jgi:hypothetical protein